MQWFFIVVMLIGGPLYGVNQLLSGAPDWGELGLMSLLFLTALGGAWKKIGDAKATANQRAYWMNQKR